MSCSMLRIVVVVVCSTDEKTYTSNPILTFTRTVAQKNSTNHDVCSYSCFRECQSYPGLRLWPRIQSDTGSEQNSGVQ